MTGRGRRAQDAAALRFAPEDAAALADLRRNLLRHHRTLMTLAQRDHERTHGRIAGPGHLLQLLMQDPEFGWLRNISGLVARLDESIESPAPGVTESIIETTAALLLESESGDAGFRSRYHRALQASPDAVVTHGTVAGSLRKLRGRRFPLSAPS